MRNCRREADASRFWRVGDDAELHDDTAATERLGLRGGTWTPSTPNQTFHPVGTAVETNFSLRGERRRRVPLTPVGSHEHGSVSLERLDSQLSTLGLAGCLSGCEHALAASGSWNFERRTYLAQALLSPKAEMMDRAGMRASVMGDERPKRRKRYLYILGEDNTGLARRESHAGIRRGSR